MPSSTTGHAWVLGDKKRGYSIKRLSRYKDEPWWSYVWRDGDIVRRDGHRTKEAATRYCYQRAASPATGRLPRGLKRHKVIRLKQSSR